MHEERSTCLETFAFLPIPHNHVANRPNASCAVTIPRVKCSIQSLISCPRDSSTVSDLQAQQLFHKNYLFQFNFDKMVMGWLGSKSSCLFQAVLASTIGTSKKRRL